MKNVLLVDDDNVFNFISTKILERMDSVKEIHTAMNGEEAIQLFKNFYERAQTLPDVVLLDLNMPIMDGFQFLEAFKQLNLENKESIRIIVVTSSKDPKDISKAKGLGINDYLTKPLQPESLQQMLDNVN